MRTFNRLSVVGVTVATALTGAVVGLAGPANAENPTCPTGSGGGATVSYNTIVSGKVCFKTDGDVFYYADTHGNDGMYGGMYYYATDGLSHDHDYEFLYDTNGPLNGWEPLNTNEVEGTWVYYRACLQHTNGIFEKCGGYVQSLA